MKAVKGKKIRPGQALPIKSVIKQGMSDEEVYFLTSLRSTRNQLVHGFVPKENIESSADLSKLPAEGAVVVTVMDYYDKDKVKLLFPGELVSGTNPVVANIKDVEQNAALAQRPCMILSYPDLVEAWQKKRIRFDPDISIEQIGLSSIDLRLGFRYSRFKSSAVSYILKPGAEGFDPADIYDTKDLNSTEDARLIIKPRAHTGLYL